MKSGSSHAFYALPDPSGHIWMTDGKSTSPHTRLVCAGCKTWTSLQLYAEGAEYPPCPAREAA